MYITQREQGLQNSCGGKDPTGFEGPKEEPYDKGTESKQIRTDGDTGKVETMQGLPSPKTQDLSLCHYRLPIPEDPVHMLKELLWHK